ncbi:MAG: hypothetical protein L0Z73_10455 [Gammaproteobacteria bacterium]|nr:hypothetical protein [Gammaproteobacteria bacterium]
MVSEKTVSEKMVSEKMVSEKMVSEKMVNNKTVNEKMVTGNNAEAHTRRWIPGVTALLALVSCKGFVIVAAIFPLVRLTEPVNPHVQAAIISLFALLTSVFIIVNHRRCQPAFGPVVLGVVSVLLILGAMYVAYSQVVEAIGLTALIASALWSWWKSKWQIELAEAMKTY